MSRSFHSSKAHQSTARLFQGAAKLCPKKNTDHPLVNPTILLVDDDPGVLVSLARVLLLENWQVITATNGEEALERLNQGQPDLMITDLNLGNISGWDLLFHENMQRPSLPIFVITALPPPLLGGADCVASGFFQKPLNLEALVEAVRRSLGFSAAASA